MPETELQNSEVVVKKDWSKVLEEMGIPVGVQRAAAMLVIAGIAAAGVMGYSYVTRNQEVTEKTPTPRFSCPGDFDVTKGVEMNKALKEYLALGTEGQGVEVGNDGVVDFDNGQLRLLKDVKGNKYTSVIGWSFTDDNHIVHSGSIDFSETAPKVVCEEN